MVCTHGENVLCNIDSKDISLLKPCTHEEADTRLLLHVADCSRDGHDNVLIRTTGTDVLGLAISSMETIGLQELWVAMGVGNHLNKYIAAHHIALKAWLKCRKRLACFLLSHGV